MNTTEERVPMWVRVVMIVPLAVPQLVVGIWALVAPHNWYDKFPGFGPHLISAEPPFNQHLATDVGAGFLATGVALVVGAIWAERSGVYVALAAFAAFAVPHFLYHATHSASALTDSQNVANVGTLGIGLVFLAAAAWGARPRRARVAGQAGEG